MKKRRGGWTWGPVEGVKLRVLSVGAGIQSTTLALMAARGEVGPLPDAMIFADTQAEISATLENLQWLEGEVTRLTNGRMECHRVSAGSLTETIERRANGEGRFVSAPFYTSNGGMGRRQCTREFKVEPQTRKQRELLGYKPRQRIPPGTCEVWIGFSVDEAIRAGAAFERWVVNRFPLLEQRMSRHDCITWLQRNDYPVPPKSACSYCPFRKKVEWRWLRDNDPDAWSEVRRIDKLIRNTPSMKHQEWEPDMYTFNADNPGDYERMKRRQEIAEAMLYGARRAPKTVGEGIYSALSDIGSGLHARSARKGREGLQNTASDFASGTFGRLSGGGGDFPPAPATSGTISTDAQTGGDPDLVSYIRESAGQRGIDPDIALRVAYSEGLAPGVWQSNVKNKRGVREPSYGPFQLLLGGPGTGYPEGLGNAFLAQTGLDPRDRSTVRQQIDFALDQAKKGGWSPWYGAAKAGIGQWDGLRGQEGASLERDIPGNMVAGLGNAGVADALRAADAMEGVQVADASGLMKRIQTSDMDQLKALTQQHQSTMTPQEVDAVRKRAYELQGMEVPADAAPIPGLAPDVPAITAPTRPVTPTPPAPIEAAPRGAVNRGGALPPTISPDLDSRMQGAPQLEAPRNVDGRTVAGVESTGNPRLDQWNRFAQRSGSKQLMDADPRKGILAALTGLGQPSNRPGFPARPGASQLTAENATASLDANPYLPQSTKRVANAMLNSKQGGAEPSEAKKRVAAAMLGGQKVPLQFASLDPANDFRTELAQPVTASERPQGIPVGDAAGQPTETPQRTQVAQNRQLTPRDVQDLLRIMNNPASSQAHKAYAQYLLQQHQAQQMTPAQKLDMELKRAQLERARQPNLTDDQREYEAAQAQGFDGTFLEFLTAVKKAGASNTTVTVGGNETPIPPYNKLPAGYVYKRDQNGQVLIDENGVPMAVPITGGPADIEAAEKAEVEANRQELAARSGNVVVQDIDRAIDIIKGKGGGFIPETGLVGGVAALIPGTDAFKVANFIKTVKSNAGFDKLQAMREASPTGGALGQVSNIELQFLQSAIGSLEQSLDDATLIDNLNRVHNIYLDIIHSPGEGPERRALSFESDLPEGVSEDDVTHTMKLHGLTREEVLERLK